MLEGYWYLKVAAGVVVLLLAWLGWSYFQVQEPKGNRSKPYEHHPWDE